MKSNKGYQVIPPDKGWSICEYKQTKKKRFKRHLLKNYAEGYRDCDGNFVESLGMQQETDALDGEKIIKIILTIAHLDHNPQNCAPENLRALCQKCHLNYDIEHHKETRRNSKKLPLFDKEKER